MLDYEFAKEMIEKSGNFFSIFTYILYISCFWAKSNPIGINVKINFAFLPAVSNDAQTLYVLSRRYLVCAQRSNFLKYRSAALGNYFNKIGSQVHYLQSVIIFIWCI